MRRKSVHIAIAAYYVNWIGAVTRTELNPSEEQEEDRHREEDRHGGAAVSRTTVVEPLPSSDFPDLDVPLKQKQCCLADGPMMPADMEITFDMAPSSSGDGPMMPDDSQMMMIWW
ncbi:hypothetical protein ACLB2K_074376 [Fragaria x ananassa]